MSGPDASSDPIRSPDHAESVDPVESSDSAESTDHAESSDDAGSSDPTAPKVGVGPYEGAWPSGKQFDPQLLATGDRRNVIDAYRYWRMDAIVADLDARRAGWAPARLQVAIQNWTHDFNIGSIVRTANAFNVQAVHVVGNRRWNRRGAMVTDRYLHVHHQLDEAALSAHCQAEGLTLIGVDNLPGSVPLESASLPAACCLVFGSEGPGLSEAMVSACAGLVAVTQYGSTRSLNAGAAAAIAMFWWSVQHQVGCDIPPGAPRG